MIFGGVNHSAYVGELINFPLKNNHWWALDIKEFSYDGYQMRNYGASDNAIAIVDTGTSLASVPSDIHAKLVQDWTNSMGAVNILCQQGICITGFTCDVTEKKLKPIGFVIDYK